eukprot:Rhum_TRINITY_DN25199_c0_g1::Rhum_TRINITY_DN25199_c0_g1_i1::g.181198::m.181198
MWRGSPSAALVVLLVGCVHGDIFLHNPMGSNNKLFERSNSVKNDARLFNSQNNEKGGYQVGDSCEPACRDGAANGDYNEAQVGSADGHLEFYEGSQLLIEWTAQHGCDTPGVNCQIILQYMCDETLRDGHTTDTIPENDSAADDNTYFGMHENYDYHLKCSKRERNKGLYTADRTLSEDKGAQATRQNNGGARSGYECQEERDYYPYWHSTPWRDIAVLTDDVARCPYYQSESENVKARGECLLPSGQEMEDLAEGQLPNNPSACFVRGYSWVVTDPHGIPPPVCQKPPKQRANHLGDSEGLTPARYAWTIPAGLEGKQCSVRVRYNISSYDIGPGKTDFNLDYMHNSNEEPWGKDNVYGDFVGFTTLKRMNMEVVGPDLLQGMEKLKLATNMDQLGRTFQDRTHYFTTLRRPNGLHKDAVIHNLNVRGRRGNIVQVFPAVEYDFVPSLLKVVAGDYVNIQWTDSDAANAGNDGSGLGGSGKSNLVFLRNNDLGTNIPSNVEQEFNPLFVTDEGEPDVESIAFFSHLSQERCVYDEGKINLKNENDVRNCAVLNRASSSVNGGLVKMNVVGRHAYGSSRNTDFSNRAQKGEIHVLSQKELKVGEVSDSTSVSEFRSAAVIVAIAAVTLLLTVYYMLGSYARSHPEKAWAQNKYFKLLHNVPDLPQLIPEGTLLFTIDGLKSKGVKGCEPNLQSSFDSPGRRASNTCVVPAGRRSSVYSYASGQAPLSSPLKRGSVGNASLGSEGGLFPSSPRGSYQKRASFDTYTDVLSPSARAASSSPTGPSFDKELFKEDLRVVMDLPSANDIEIISVDVTGTKLKVQACFTEKNCEPGLAAEACEEIGIEGMNGADWQIDSIVPVMPEAILEDTRKRSRRTLVQTKLLLFSMLVLLVWGALSHREYYIKNSNPWLPLAKAGGVPLNFMLVLLPMPTMKMWLGSLRDTPAELFMDLDSGIEFHKLIAKCIFFLMTIHVTGHILDTQWFSNRPCPKPHCADRQCACMKGPWGYTWGEQLRTLPGWSGVTILVLFLVIFFNAIPWRRNAPNTQSKRVCPFTPIKVGAKAYGGWDRFWYTHHLWIPAYMLLLLHAPKFYCWCAVPLLFFALEKSCTYWRLCQPAHIESVSLVSRDVVQLTIFKQGFRHLCGQYAKIVIPDFSPFVAHPFTISSDTERNRLSVHIRCGGGMDWTNRLKDHFFADALAAGKKLPIRRDFEYVDDSGLTVAVDGPFSTATQQFVDYEVCVLVGAGIGVTPFASILKAVNSGRSALVPHKVYFFWIVNEESHLSWFSDLMNDVKGLNKDTVEITTYVTGDFDLEEYRRKQAKQSGGDKKWTVQRTGRPNWRRILPKLAETHKPPANYLRTSIGVFFCGPPALGATIASLCDSQSTPSVKFDFHKEVF